MQMIHNVLIVGDASDSSGLQVLEAALHELGHMVICSEGDLGSHLKDRSYDAAVVDAGAVSDPEGTIRTIHGVQPNVQIVVITASPHWKIARGVFRAGATDYLRKSKNSRELRTVFVEMLGSPLQDTCGGRQSEREP